MLKLYCNIIISGLLLFSGCASAGPSSMEFRSAKTSARSEKNLKRAEEWALKAMDMEIHAADASVPYFIAVEIYKPQKRWVDMAAMLDEAMLRNPDQKLDAPKQLRAREQITKENIKDSFAYTIGEAVTAYRQELWVNLYNGALDAYQKGKKEEAIEQFKLALNVDPAKSSTYIVLAKFYKEDENMDASNDMIDKALNLNNLSSDDATELLLIKAENFKSQQNWDQAMLNYEKAFIASENESMAAVLSILEINLMTENYLNAIDWGEKAMSQRSKIDRVYFSHLLYNIGLSYRGAGAVYYDKAVEIITQINNGEDVLLSSKKDGINNLNISKDYFTESRLYFLDAAVEGMEDAQELANQTRDLLEQVNEIYIPFLNDYTPK